MEIEACLSNENEVHGYFYDYLKSSPGFFEWNEYLESGWFSNKVCQICYDNTSQFINI